MVHSRVGGTSFGLYRNVGDRRRSMDDVCDYQRGKLQKGIHISVDVEDHGAGRVSACTGIIVVISYDAR
jgi:hypothetical protein